MVILSFSLDKSIEDIQESSAFSDITSVLCGHSTSSCCDICDGAQGLSMENWLGHEPPCCCLCCNKLLPSFLYRHEIESEFFNYICRLFLMFSGNCDIKHIILCSRTGYKDEGSSICHCFQPSDDDHSCNHGLFHTGWEDFSWRVIFNFSFTLTVTFFCTQACFFIWRKGNFYLFFE